MAFAREIVTEVEVPGICYSNPSIMLAPQLARNRTPIRS
jgi:hypothetical protein